MRGTLVAMLVGIASLAAVACGGGNDTVTFPDENLEAVIRDALDKPPGEKITAGELAEITYLDSHVIEGGIADLTGIELLYNLTELQFVETQISDISPLASLTSLTKLSLDRNRISDITPLASLTNLTKLFLYRNRISDITPLASLTNLTMLFLDHNQISDITPLASLTNLEALRLEFNQISDISPLVENSALGLEDNDPQDAPANPLVCRVPSGGNTVHILADLVTLKGNNLDLSEGSEDLGNIGALEERGMQVGY